MHDLLRSNSPTVSICCITYNQASYLKDAIESFINQKTSFNFEIIIHDDASTDETPEILRDYLSKYPSLIRVISQVENQYSKGKKISKDFVWPIAQGEYIALCEGDDYWIDPYKLQKQFDALSSNSVVDLCFGYGFKLYKNGNFKKFNFYGNKIKLINVRDVIALGGGAMPTASIMFRKNVIDRIPDWYDFAPVGDYYMQCISSSNGAIYLPDAFCVYRVQSDNSWSSSFDKIKLDYLSRNIESLKKLDSYYNYRYKKEVLKVKARSYYFVACSYLRSGDASSARFYFKKIFDESNDVPIIYRVKFFVSYIPFLSFIYSLFYKRVNS